ncbi:MAG: transglutaminase domain-containing protein [Bdellovibrionota bacterium]
MKSLLLLFIVFYPLKGSASDQNKDRLIRLYYNVTIRTDTLNKQSQIYVPLTTSNQNQDILERKISSPIPGSVSKDQTYGNEFWYAAIPLNRDNDKGELQITIEYLVKRRKQIAGSDTITTKIDAQQLPSNPQYLSANQRVPISGKFINDILAVLSKTDGSKLGMAKVIYDFVIDNMEYKKVGTGWGQGDTEWAYSKKYGNCTDFHALFISLARSQGITARFKMGLPIPENNKEGIISGYHCWVEFYLPKIGWVPIDASEAKKSLDKREFYFGQLPADRILFSIGRDIVLNSQQKSGSLNYFIFPFMEADGKRINDSIKTKFIYRELKAKI